MFEDYKVFETTLAGRPLKVETGKVAQLANGSCMVRYGDTVVLCTATMSAKPREGVDFFPWAKSPVPSSAGRDAPARRPS